MKVFLWYNIDTKCFTLYFCANVFCLAQLKCLQICVYPCRTNLWMSEGKEILNKKNFNYDLVCAFSWNTADTTNDDVVLTLVHLTPTSSSVKPNKGQEKYADRAVRFTHLYFRGTIRPVCTTQYQETFQDGNKRVIFSAWMLVLGKKKLATNV